MWPSLVDERHYEVAHFTDLKWAWDAKNIVMNKELWDSLPIDLRKSARPLLKLKSTFADQEQAQEDYIAFLEKQEGFEIIW